MRVLPSSFRMEEHPGDWVVLVNDCVVETGQDLSSCLARARSKHPKDEPTVLKIPGRGLQRRALPTSR